MEVVKIILESESTSYVNASTAEAIKDTLQSKFEKYIQTGDSLYEYLENIPFSNSVLHGNSMHYKISDGKLVFSIMYTQRLVLQETSSPLMGKLYQKDNIRV